MVTILYLDYTRVLSCSICLAVLRSSFFLHRLTFRIAVKILAITASDIDFNGIEIVGVLKKPFHVDLLVCMVRKLAKPTVTLANIYCL
jgi:hypothetical protein